EAPRDIRVAATIFPLQDMAQNIVGDTMTVGLILPAGASPHTFEPTPSTLRDLQSTELVFAVGHGLDDWTQTLVNNSPAEIVTVDRGIQLLASDEGDGADPHYFLTIDNAKIIVTTMHDELILLFPEYRDEFSVNTQNYLQSLDAAEAQIQTILADSQDKPLITLHDGWYYFAEAYGIKIAGTFEPTAGREPTPQYLVELKDAVKSTGTTTIYSEPQLSIESINSFVSDYNLKVAELDPIGGYENRDSYINLMLYNVHVIAAN
ncbi:MAG: metal ABC transporter substrate-binding protein, partial [Patescibacteria group bacterium]